MLSFSSVSRSDGGRYTCQAFNHIKSHSELKTSLTVECKYHIHTYVTIVYQDEKIIKNECVTM